MYNIKKYSYDKANELNLKIYPSKNQKYKIDIYDLNNNYIASIGSINYSDYPTYIKTHGLQYANERRRLYKLRHNKDRHKLFSKGYLADHILW